MIQDAQVVGSAIRLGFSVACLVLIWQYVMLPSLRDGLRATLFEIRRELFLFADSGAVPFNHPAYVEIRSSLNWFIRNAEKLNFGRMLLLMKFADPPMPSRRSLEDALCTIDSAEARDALRAFRHREMIALGAHSLHTSLVAWAFFAAAMARVGRKGGRRKEAASALAERLPTTRPSWDLCGT